MAVPDTPPFEPGWGLHHCICNFMPCRLISGTVQSGAEPCDDILPTAKACQADAPPALRLGRAGLPRLVCPSPPHAGVWLPICPSLCESWQLTSEWDPGMVAAGLPAPLGGGPWLISLAASSCSYSVAISEGVFPSCSHSQAHTQGAGGLSMRWAAPWQGGGGRVW